MEFKRTRHAQPFVLFFFAQALLTLLIGLPGQMSVDALVQLYEGQQVRLPHRLCLPFSF